MLSNQLFPISVSTGGTRGMKAAKYIVTKWSRAVLVLARGTGWRNSHLWEFGLGSNPVRQRAAARVCSCCCTAMPAGGKLQCSGVTGAAQREISTEMDKLGFPGLASALKLSWWRHHRSRGPLPSNGCEICHGIRKGLVVPGCQGAIPVLTPACQHFLVCQKTGQVLVSCKWRKLVFGP